MINTNYNIQLCLFFGFALKKSNSEIHINFYNILKQYNKIYILVWKNDVL